MPSLAARMVVLAVLAASCGSDRAPEANAVQAPVAQTTPTEATTPAPAAVVGAPSPKPREESFRSEVLPIDDTIAARMRSSWRSGCPVPLERLRYVTVRHWTSDQRVADGELVVRDDVSDDIVSVFAALFAAKFPIERMKLVDDYGGNDGASMRANNTSAFNCRAVAGRPGVLSEHANGTAIDINPLVNPWVAPGRVDPPEGAAFVDRTTKVPGGIYPDDVVVRAFRAIGWGWGGDWPESKDWQHFSLSGR